MTLRIAVAGFGVMGRTHAQALHLLPDVAVVAVADPDLRALAGVDARTYDDPLAMVRTADVDAVVVASPDASHAALVLACVGRGLPVLCEKPLTATLDEAHQVFDAEAATGRRLVQVGFMRRFDPAFAAVADTVASGAVGRPAVVRTRHRNPVTAYPFTPSVLVLNSASHDVDLVRWLTGDEVVEVTCSVAGGADGRFAAVLLSMRTSGGVLAHVELAYGPACGYDVGCEVLGPDGSASTPHEVSPDWVERFADAYRRQDAAWVALLRGGLAVSASAQDGLANVRVLEAAGRALVSGRTEPVGAG